ncbi:hypothetical protein D3C76_1844800 [compost metagenome]
MKIRPVSVTVTPVGIAALKAKTRSGVISLPVAVSATAIALNETAIARPIAWKKAFICVSLSVLAG